MKKAKKVKSVDTPQIGEILSESCRMNRAGKEKSVVIYRILRR